MNEPRKFPDGSTLVSRTIFDHKGMKVEEIVLEFKDRIKIVWARCPFDQMFVDLVENPCIHSDHSHSANNREVELVRSLIQKEFEAYHNL